MQEGDKFKHTYKLSPRWFRQFKSSYRRRGYEFHHDREQQLELIYAPGENGDHVLTYSTRTGETFTDWTLSKLMSIMEDMGGVGAPMAPLGNTPGMGNATPPSAATGGIGSGDSWGDASVGKMATNEENINPYDTLGTSMAKKMGVKTPFKKKKSNINQNTMKQRKYEHSIISLDNFMNINENDTDTAFYRKKVFAFLDAPWQEDADIYFIAILDEYRNLYRTSSMNSIRDYLKRVYEANEKNIIISCSESFLNQLEDLINVKKDSIDVNESIWTIPKRIR
jgi:hypothetical protein